MTEETKLRPKIDTRQNLKERLLDINRSIRIVRIVRQISGLFVSQECCILNSLQTSWQMEQESNQT